MTGCYFVSGKRKGNREKVSIDFKNRKSANKFKIDLENNLRKSIPKYKWVRNLKVVKC